MYLNPKLFPQPEEKNISSKKIIIMTNKKNYRKVKISVNE
jgi:hypothetical protein